MDSTQAKELRDYAWKYFDLHAKQRMSVFNFFLVLAGLLAASYVRTMSGESPSYGMGAILGAMLLIVAFVFWRLDQRTAFLIQNAETALMKAEEVLSDEAPEPTVSQLFRFEANQTKKLTRRWFSTHFTYSRCLRSVFLVFGLAGLIGTAVSLIWMFGAMPTN